MTDLRNIVADVESGGATAEDALGQMGAILTDLFGEHSVPEDEEEG